MEQPTNTPRSRMRALVTLFCILALGLVVLGLVTAQLLRRQSTTGTSSAGSTVAALTTGGPSAAVTAGGLTMTLQVSPGPYFLSELIAARMTLANSSPAPLDMQGAPWATDCDPALSIILSGSAPRYTIPTVGRVSCPPIERTLLPGKSWTIDELLPLTASGHVTLTMEARFIVQKTDQNGRSYQTGTDGPFAGRWPSLQINVAPAIPAGRIITLHPDLTAHPYRVRMTTPQAVTTQFYSIDVISCSNGGGASSATIRLSWLPVPDAIFTEPSCPGTSPVWTYSVGAVGYAIASGRYPPKP